MPILKKKKYLKLIISAFTLKIRIKRVNEAQSHLQI